MNKVKEGPESAYPIKTYAGFEHKDQETFIDPLAGVLEVMSNIEPYELMATQLIIKPVADAEWKKDTAPILQKLKGAPAKPHPPGLIETVLFNPINSILDGILGLVGIPPAEKKPEKKDQPPSLMQYLSEGEKQVIAAVERQLSKISYEVHFRILYLTPKGRLNKALRIPEIIGAYRHFGDYASQTSNILGQIKALVL
jgi:hypothetical protein